MFPIHFKLTVSTVAQLQRLTAFLEQDSDQAKADAPRLSTAATDGSTGQKTATEAPGKPSAASTAPSPRTAGAAPSPSAQPDAAPAKSTEATQPDAAASSAADKPVAYADLQKAVLTLHKMDPQAAVPIAKGLGADTFKALPEDKWAEALRLVTEAIETRKVA